MSKGFYIIRINDKDGCTYLHSDSMEDAQRLLIEYLAEKDDVFGFEIKVELKK